MSLLAVAHRGDPHAHWENTVPAVLSAIEQGADLVEIDLELTRDGELILLHDADLVRLWENPGRVAELTLAEIRAARAGRYEIPAFAAVLSVLQATGATLMVDIGEPHIAKLAVAEVTRAGLLPQALFVGTPEAMFEVRAGSADARIGVSVGNLADLPETDDLAALGPEYLNPHWPLLTTELIDQWHAAGFGVSCWTVDSPSTMAHLIDQGVDMIITNRIGRLLAIREGVAA